jgi:CBS-domain-containing membrane protein
MNTHNIRRLIVVDNDNRLQGIITEKDIFREISKNLTLINDFIGQNSPTEFKEAFGRFGDYMFELLPKI